MNDDEVDLRPYLSALFNNKWWIIGLGLLIGLIVLFAILLVPRRYTANATLLLTRSRSTLSLAEQFPTVTEPVDTRSRMDALMTLAQGDAIANLTLQSLGDEIPNEYRSIEDIKSLVKIRSDGDSISIAAVTEDPELSAKIANTWANFLSETINIAYSGEQPLNKIQEQLKTTEEEYKKAQSDLEAFIRENSKLDLETRRDEAKSLLAVYGNERAVRMTYYLNRKQSMDELHQQASALKLQLENGNHSTAGNIGDALAVILARMNATLSKPINITDPPSNNNVIQQPGTMINLQVTGDFSEDNRTGYSADIDAIIQLTEDEVKKADANIQQLVQETINPDPTRLETIASTTEEIQALDQQIEAANAKELELTSNRDLTWKAFQALAQKETEIKSTTLTNNQVTIASEAIVPIKPDPRGIAQKVMIGFLAGVFLGVTFIICLYWWRSLNLSGTKS